MAKQTTHYVSLDFSANSIERFQRLRTGLDAAGVHCEFAPAGVHCELAPAGVHCELAPAGVHCEYRPARVHGS